ncbi:unnamed protein product [Tilletia caries]|uniref:Sugar phosphate transporter domain-containing protein n=2 Tax=Tilletia caries TaxID=13290 RepID=A0ABN7J6B3_9BASI|nr:hypothetical protein CF336_g1743 [Tilletia laevis]CAD6889817.1 unnamed protein product [Tilletia caries]KAE8207330.1 hypothetical protein CF335_g1221 [Tilletia laevis]CAD6949529.1 unnamed protein product [Tilletia caries]CAD6955006.1 unnamed protein product [Tilletia caries]
MATALTLTNSPSPSSSSIPSGYPPKPASSTASGDEQHPPSPIAYSVRSTASAVSTSSKKSAPAPGPSYSNPQSHLPTPSLDSSLSDSAASYDIHDDTEHNGGSGSGSAVNQLSANRAGRSSKTKHALFFSTSKARDSTSGRSTPVGLPADNLPYSRQSIEETQPLRPGSSSASIHLNSRPHSSSHQMPRNSGKSLSGSSHADDDDDHDDGIDEVELTPASSRRLSRTDSAAAELQGAFGFGGASQLPGGGLTGRTVQERRRAYWRSAALNLLLIASWYLFSTLISLYNKWMFDKKHYDFAYPLFVTCFHMIVQAILSASALCIFERQLVAKRPNGRRERPTVAEWGTKVVPCGVATALDVGLSNLSLKTITLTFYTMCKSSNLAFVLFFAFVLRLEKVRLSLIGIIGLITIGVIMMVAAETQFVLVGAIEVLTASVMGGLRWALAQMLLDGRKNANGGMGMARNPIATIFWLAPVMAVSMAVASMVMEDWRVVLRSRHFRDGAASLKTLGLVTAPGVLAFCMHLSEFALIQRTSVVTLSVAGIFKEVSTIILASTIFGDELTPINVTGLCITILGIVLYNWLKYRLNIHSPSSGGHSGAMEGGEGASSYGGTESANLRHRGEYTEIFDRDAENGEDEDEPPQQRQQRGGGGSKRSNQSTFPPSSTTRTRETEEVLSPEEAERRRRREEEADMDGWSTAGVEQTGNGWYE